MRSVVVLLAVIALSCVRAQAGSGARGACNTLPASNASLELVVLGSGGPRGVGRAASAYLVRVAGVPRVLIDVGPGAFFRLGELDVDFDQLDTVLLTHLHVDHSGDVPAFVKSRDLSYRRPLEFNFYGPTGAGECAATSEFIGALFGAQGAFRYLTGFRNSLDLRVTDEVSPLLGVPEQCP